MLTSYQELQKELSLSLQDLNSFADKFQESYDIIVSPNEVNERHGVGVLLKRNFPDTSRIVSLRTTNLYEGDQDFGVQNFCLDVRGCSYGEILVKIQNLLVYLKPKRVLVIPYFTEDFYVGAAIKSLFQVPVCTYLMDDQNVYVNAVEDEAVQKLLDSSDLILGISLPLCQVYEKKYRQKIWFIPPVVESYLFPPEIVMPDLMGRGVLIGNIWSQNWLEKLRQLCRESQIKIDWYGNPNRQWLQFQEEELAQDGIFFQGYCPQADLINRLRQAPFALVPTGSSAEEQDRPEIAYLSLPSRIPFIVAAANTPILVVGQKDSAAAKFVQDFDLGSVCDYASASFLTEIAKLRTHSYQLKLRQASHQLAKSLKADNFDDWLWRSLEQGQPIDNRFAIFQNHCVCGSVVITACEVNQQHGTGPLVKRIFPDNRQVISIRSANHYGGEQNFGAFSLVLDHRELSRPEIFQSVLKTLAHNQIERVFCVPYYASNLLTAIAIKELFNVPLATYIMDDQNICVQKIPDALMKEFLSKCSVRFATHPELRDAYENKYGYKFWLLPAIVPHRLINSEVAEVSPQRCQEKWGALLGSIWSPQWFQSLLESIQGAGIKLDWYGNSNYYWLKESAAELEKWGLYSQGLYPEEQLGQQLQAYPFVIVPTGTMDERDDRTQLSRLSLPGRIIFNLATANTPVILLGSNKTSAANFINRFQIGVVCDYTPESLAAAVDYVLDPENQQRMRENAVKVAAKFSDQGINQWVRQSIEQEQAADDRFEAILPRSPIDLVHFIEPPVPAIIYKDYAQVYQVMRRLRGQKYQPDFVVDVGASHGIWSHTASQLFPEARFILIDPLISKYEQSARNYYICNIPKAELLEIAISNQAGQLSFQVSPDLYGSSLLTPADFRNYETITVAVKTLDQVATDEQISGRGILKLDVQCAEHIVLEGAKEFIAQVDLVVAELSFIRYDQDALVFNEMLNLLDQLGFRYYDETGEWRSPIDGTLLQKEVVFIRQDLLVPETSRKIENSPSQA
ncbi:MAG: FkbM family methyltransferase [Microcystis sp. M04BS1]|nr:FkbM family methyltransferase [Microcystis sp. M04BS1]